jgi:hypothetical protein
VTALHEYLALYAPYEKLLRLDIGEYIKGLETSETGLSELTAEIDKHAKELVKIESAIPASVTIGPFAVCNACIIIYVRIYINICSYIIIYVRV